MAKVLGLSFFFHDSAAALVCDGQIIAAGAEERFNRIKHYSDFPKRAIEYCLDEGRLKSINELDAIVFYEKPVLKLFRAVEGVVSTWPRSYETFIRKLPSFLSSKVNIYEVLHENLPGYHGRVLFSQHHLSHASSAFYCSPYDHAAILTMDGVGEWETTTFGEGRGREIRLRQSIHFPHSIGLLYSALTAFLGFEVNDGEWKVMGLAPYGEPKYADQFRKLIAVKPDGSYHLNLRYFAHHYSPRWGPNLREWERLFGFPRRDPEATLEQHHEDVARSGQVVVEEIILNLARHVRKNCDSDNLVIAGGVGLNCVANWRIEKEGIFKNVWIQPAAGDDGGALGAALLVSQLAFHDAPCPEMKNTYLGPAYQDEDIVDYLESRQIPYERFDDDELVQQTADLIAQDQVVGWFQGRMEFGPRALGARSILATPTKAEMKANVNQKIKFREYFRPFAPAVPIEHVHEYFEVPPGTGMPFMVKVPRVRSDKCSLIPAVTHEDGTGRVQTVQEEGNPLYYKLLKALEPRIGVPIVLNTSFNVRGEPIVCSPEDAYECFMKTGINALVLGHCVIREKTPIRIDLSVAESSKSTAPSDASAFQAISQRVLDFYKELPFNYYSNSLDNAVELLRKNRMKDYPLLHHHLKQLKGAHVLDVGCGAGWFVNSCAHYYQHSVVGIEVNPVALQQARSVARLFPDPSKTQWRETDLFKYRPDRTFEVVNSLGVLHHTPDCQAAIEKCLEWVKEGGYLHLGLYHSYGRKPFLEHFAKLRRSGASVSALYEEFTRLNPNITDKTHMMSWFRDQVLHPHETQHTYEEIAPLLESKGFKIEATSINHFKSISGLDTMRKLEKGLEDYARRQLVKKNRYFPGFFILWARKKN